MKKPGRKPGPFSKERGGVQILARFSKEEAAALKAHALEMGVSRQFLVRAAAEWAGLLRAPSKGKTKPQSPKPRTRVKRS